jgi:hypothetical protein
LYCRENKNFSVLFLFLLAGVGKTNYPESDYLGKVNYPKQKKLGKECYPGHVKSSTNIRTG